MPSANIALASTDITSSVARKKKSEKAFLSANAINVLEKRYLKKDRHGVVVETPAAMFRRVANAIAEAEKLHGMKNVRKIADQFYNLMTCLDFLPNSPTLMNAGNALGQLSACFVVPVEDSTESIFDAVKYSALIHKSGGGTGFDFSAVRMKNAEVRSTQGVASGPISFMRIFDTATDVVKQGGRRRGANMGILRVDHPDIMDFIGCKTEDKIFSNFNISVGITGAFMDALSCGNECEYSLSASAPISENAPVVSCQTLKAGKVFDKIVENAWLNGEPGVIFLDHINSGNTLPGLGQLGATNPCVSGDTEVLTKEGFVRIADLAGEPTTLWNGHEWTTVAPEVTGTNQPMVRVFFSDGSYLDCTTYHRFTVETSTNPKCSKVADVLAKDLSVGMKLERFGFPVIEGGESVEARLVSLAALLDANGSSCEDGAQSVRSTDRDFLWNVKKTLHTLGVGGVMASRKDELADTWTLTISRSDIAALVSMGMKAKGIDASSVSQDPVNPLIEVTGIESLPNAEVVYCFTDKIRGKGMFGCVATGQCGEQPLYPWESCNLGSINLSNMVAGGLIDYDHLREVVHLAVRFLDNVIDVNNYPLPQIEEMTRKTRKIGLGVMGFADMLIKLGIPYASEKARDIAEEVMSFIQGESRVMSAWLGEQRGNFPAYGLSIYAQNPETPYMRNATTTTIAPTGTLSIIADCSSGIEPLFALSYERWSVDRGNTMQVSHPLFEEVAGELGLSPAVMDQIAEAKSVRGIPEVPEHVQSLFMTAHDVDPYWHIQIQAAFQWCTDNAVSKTINFPHTATREDIANAFRTAHASGCKGLTVYRDGSREGQVLGASKEKTVPVAAVTAAPKSFRQVEPRPRPDVTVGVTQRMETGCGKLYVTINRDEFGVCEVFASIGKTGGCAQSQVEATGRLASIALRSGVKIEAIINELAGIRCPSPCWHQGGQIFSCSDAIGKALAAQVNAKVDTVEHTPATCPDCGSTIVFEEGCLCCKSCGYSKCS